MICLPPSCDSSGAEAGSCAATGRIQSRLHNMVGQVHPFTPLQFSSILRADFDAVFPGPPDP